MKRFKRTVALLTACLAVGACTSSNDAGPDEVAASGVRIPAVVLGLQVAVEDITKESTTIKQSYLDSIGMFSMREDELLRATLQVSRLSRIARPKSEGFRASVAALLGGSTPTELQVDRTTIYSTSGNKQNIFVWFRERGMFILSIHQDYEFPRTLLRRAISFEIR